MNLLQKLKLSLLIPKDNHEEARKILKRNPLVDEIEDYQKACTRCNENNPISYFTGGKRICKKCSAIEREEYLNKNRDSNEPDDHSEGCTYGQGDYYGSSYVKECECHQGWFDHKRNCKCECEL